ncbi:MAG: SPOR domain-containing protein [Candidatus Binataceae bacterium]
MRFEIKAGGFFVILIGLLGLSGAVFFFGVMAGNEIAKQNTPDAAQVSSEFPLPSPPAVEATPTAAPEAALGPTAVPMAAVSPVVHSHPAIFTPMAAASPAEFGEPAAPKAAGTPALASASTPAESIAAHKHPFNIQIEAVMDKDGADQMVQRLQTLGYPASSETTDIDGQLWYRVKVGPYDSQEEATAAQEQLRAQYKARFAAH